VSNVYDTLTSDVISGMHIGRGVINGVECEHGLSARSLEKHRSCGTGPKYWKLGGRVVYALADLKAWPDMGIKQSTSDPGTVTVLPPKRILAAGCSRPHPTSRDRAPAGNSFVERLAF
jgi:hypothetical protein